MSKNEKIKFEDLEKLTGKRQEPLSETDLLELLNDPQKLGGVMQIRRMEFFGTMLSKMAESQEFRDKVLEALTKRKQK